MGPGTDLLEPSGPQLERECLDAEMQLKGVAADLANLRAQPEDRRLNQESLIAVVGGEYLQAKAQYDGRQQAEAGLIGQMETRGGLRGDRFAQRKVRRGRCRVCQQM